MCSYKSNMSSTPYSLENPPKAPKATTRMPKPYKLERIPPFHLSKKEDEKKADWRYLRDCGWVRQKFLRYNPEDVEEIDDLDLLQNMLEWYNPQSQPRNVFEHSYIDIMRDAVQKRLYML